MRPEFKEGDKVYLLRKNIKTKQSSNKLDYKKLGLFKIDKKIGSINYKFKLPRIIEIYLIFHILFLKPVLLDIFTIPVTEIQ
jgi:hypothetical protein